MAPSSMGPQASGPSVSLMGLGGSGPSMALHNSSSMISVRKGTFSWEMASEPVLRDINLEVARGQLMVVVGQVGSGKSSLLQALLGEMHRRMGGVRMAGTVAYTAQDPWIQNSTLRNNVLFGSEYDEEQYSAVLAACSLAADLEMLPAGDQSEIGEKGINLSGGQKHRVALARACYAGADIYLLDDPLSAVDAHVGRHLFDECICGLLADRTRILVTHQLQYLPSADVVVIMSGGQVQDIGPYHALLAKGVDFHQYVAEDKKEGAAGEAGKDTQAQGKGDQGSAGTKLGLESTPAPPAAPAAAVKPAPATPALPTSTAANPTPPAPGMASMAAAGRRPDALRDTGDQGDAAVQPAGQQQQGEGEGEGEALLKAGPGPSAASASSPRGKAERERIARSLTMKEKDGKIIKVEERAVGRVKKEVYRAYIASWSAWIWLPITIIVIAFVERGLQVLQNFVLSAWSNATARFLDEGGPEVHKGRYLSLYFILGVISIVAQLVRAFLLIIGSIHASRQLQRQLLTKVVRLPMSFFDSQPTGRLLNRFTKDMESVDVQVAGSINMALVCFVNATLSLLVVVIVTPLATVAIVPLGYLYYRVQRVYIATSRELKRLDSLALSPIFQNFNETLQGLATIRAFRKQDVFMEKNRALIDSSNRAYWPIQVVNRWLSVRLELMGAVVTFATALFVTVVFPQNAGLAGLALTSALNLTGIMNWMVRQTTELEINMNSVERLIEYQGYEEEAPSVVEGARPPPDWPSHGAICVCSLVVRYRPELDPVLRGLSFDVRSCEKIGVCGRTGCGKSTLMLTLYRLIEPSGGSIVIDGVDISTIGLRDLRSKLSLVPQDPVIFSGTIRSNLDPFGQAQGDHEIWEAVRRAGCASFVKQEDNDHGLDTPIKEGGSNLSVGQRQLLCMARALLRNSKVLVLDEATSNVDNSTDALIQRTIREAFQHCTMLTIAHRLHTIMDSSRVLVLDQGRLVEFDTPRNLMMAELSPRDGPGSPGGYSGGYFRALVEETTRSGGVNADLIMATLGLPATPAAGHSPKP